jgi:S1-C subfamily serine protease
MSGIAYRRWLSSAIIFAMGGCAAGTPSGGWPAQTAGQEVPLSASPGRYNYTGVNIRVNGTAVDPNAVLMAATHQDAVLLGQITPEPNPIGGRARIVLPDHDRLRLVAVPPNRASANGLVDFMAENVRLNLHLLADTVLRSNLFSSLELVEQNDTVAPDPSGVDYLIWFQVTSVGPNNAGPWVGRWQMKRGAGPTLGNLNIDPGTPPGPARVKSFVQSIRLAATQGSAGPGWARAALAGQAVSSGTGIVVDAQGHVLTNNHVIATCPSVRLTDTSGNSTGAELLATDTANDLALLKTQHHWGGWARFRDSDGLKPGEPVVVTGFPLSGLVSPDMAVTTGSLTTLSGAKGDTRQIQFSAPTQPGNIGGPVLDDSGRVIGVTTSILNGLVVALATGGAVPQNVNFALKTDIAREFLNANQVTVESGHGRQALGAAGVGDLARHFTVKIECVR